MQGGGKVIATVRTLYPFEGEEPGDLTFQEDQIIRVYKQVILFVLFLFRIQVDGGTE